MKILNSGIFDLINICLEYIQNKTDKIRLNSLILSSIDIFILVAIATTLILSTIAQTEVIGSIASCVPILVIIKVLITKGEKIELESANFFLLIYLLICFISNFTSSMIPQSLYGFMKTSIYFAFYFAICQFLKNNSKYIKVILALIAVLVSAESFIGISQNIFGVESISTWQDTSYVNPEDVISRVYGTLKPYNPNLFAGWLVAAFPALFGLTALLANNIKNKSLKIKYLCIISSICLLASMLTIFLTGCRGAYIALFAGFLTIIIASFQLTFFNETFKKFKKYWINSVITLIGCSGLFLIFNHSILQRILSIFILRGDSSTSFRMNVYSSAIQMFQDNWLQGIGVGNKVFREIYGLYMLSGFDALSCYCIFLEMAVESGIFSLLAFLIFLFVIIKSAIKNFIHNNDINYKILILSVLIAVIGTMIHGFVDTVYFRPQIQFVFWTMVAILVTLTREK